MPSAQLPGLPEDSVAAVRLALKDLQDQEPSPPLAAVASSPMLSLSLACSVVSLASDMAQPRNLVKWHLLGKAFLNEPI